MSARPDDDPDRALAVERGPEIELREKGSRFLGQAFPAEDDATVQRTLAKTAVRWPDATHHCWAARLGFAEPCAEHAHDAGEPGGTAGVPILGAIQRERLVDTLVIVTRYFGGTQLGRGGLVRAYGECARQALSAAPRRTVWSVNTIIVTCDYPDVGAVEAVLARAGPLVHTVERRFEQRATITLTARCSVVSATIAELRDATRGRARVVEA